MRRPAALALVGNRNTGKDTHRSAVTGLWLRLCLAAIVVVGCGGPSTAPGWTFGPLDAAREELTGYIEDVTAADGYAYDPRDNMGNSIAGGKVLQRPEGGFVAVYGYWDEPTHEFRVHVGTSEDLLNWTWLAELGRQASQPTIREATDGGYVVGWEQEPDNHLKFEYFASLADLLSNRPTKTFEPPRQLSTCAEGTPSFYSASSTFLDVAFHHFRNCQVDRQARATSNWSSWSSSAQPELDAAMEAHGVRGGIGDRDGPFNFRGHDFMMFEGMREPEHWETFRVFLYDSQVGSSLQLDMNTHGGSLAFTNPTINQVTLNGREVIVVSMFIPMEAGAEGEIGGVIYYRYISDE